MPIKYNVKFAQNNLKIDECFLQISIVPLDDLRLPLDILPVVGTEEALVIFSGHGGGEGVLQLFPRFKGDGTCPVLHAS